MTDVVDQVTHEYTPETSGGSFVMRIAKEGQATVDGRIFEKNAIGWRNPPLPLMFIRANDPSGRGGHKSSVAVGTITDIWKETGEEGFSTVYGRGYFATDEEGQQARNLIKEGVISGVSADVGGAVVEELELDEDFDGVGPQINKKIISGEIVAVTCLPIPAFDDMKVSVTASAGGPDWKPESEWFTDPRFDEVTPITVTADGRVFGHVAAWGTCHVGYRDRCVTPPRSNSNYQYFNVGNVLTADGKTINVGRLTAGTNHASIEFGAQPAADHYDHTGWAAAYVHSGEDEYGIWCAGAVSPTATPAQIATIRAASVSGDWRSINGALEMVGVLAVNSPGFPVPRTRAGIVAGAQVSLVAAGMVNKADCGCGCRGKEPCKDDVEELRINMEEDLAAEPFIEEDEEDAQPLEEQTEVVVEEEENNGQELLSIEDQLATWDVEILFPVTI